MNEIYFTDFPMNDNWVAGHHQAGYSFEAKLYDAPSMSGIRRGRVSKLNIETDSTGEIIADYDRGWNTRASTQEEKKVVKAILAFLENAPIRFS